MTASEALLYVAEYLDLTDKLVLAIGRMRGDKKTVTTDEVQLDLKALAEWFGLHPEIAQDAWEHVKRRK